MGNLRQIAGAALKLGDQAVGALVEQPAAGIGVRLILKADGPVVFIPDAVFARFIKGLPQDAAALQVLLGSPDLGALGIGECFAGGISLKLQGGQGWAQVR